MSEYIYETQGEQVIGNPKGFILPKEEVVRCRDCRHSSREYKDFRYCYRLGEYKEFFVEPDNFCSWGESRHER